MGLNRKNYLEKVPIFDALSPRQRLDLSRRSVCVELEEGDLLFDEGSEGHELVVVLTGSVDIVRGGRVVARLDRGNTLGEGAVLTREHRNSRAVAHTQAKLVCIGESDVEAVAAKSPEFRRQLDDLRAAREAVPAATDEVPVP